MCFWDVFSLKKKTIYWFMKKCLLAVFHTFVVWNCMIKQFRRMELQDKHFRLISRGVYFRAFVFVLRTIYIIPT